MRWLRDEEFIRGNMPMTKFEVRALSLSMMEISNGDVFLDIGAGTGSISVQAALLGAKVFAVEKEAVGSILVKRNSERFKVEFDIIKGTAPYDIRHISGFNKCFIGGSGGNMSEIIEYVDSKLPAKGIICGNFIIPDNMVDFKNTLKDLGYIDIEVRQITSAYMDKLGMMKGNNPVYIVKGIKK
jgi:cobalt-precorrin-6B (C15)-methyltransferase